MPFGVLFVGASGFRRGLLVFDPPLGRDVVRSMLAAPPSAGDAFSLILLSPQVNPELL